MGEVCGSKAGEENRGTERNPGNVLQEHPLLVNDRLPQRTIKRGRQELKHMIFVGIDPGKKGAIAYIDEDKVLTMPYTDERMCDVCRELNERFYSAGDETRCCVEKVGAMPGQGTVSMFSFGKSAGFIEGVLHAFRIPYQLVPPQTWKKEFSLSKQGKEKSVEVCKRLFPGVSLFPTARCTKENDGMAEALLMAEYAKRKM